MSKEKRPFSQFIACVLVVSMACGTMLGIGLEIAKPFAAKASEGTQSDNSKGEFSFDRLDSSSDIDYTKLQYVPDMTTSEIMNKVGPSIVYIESTVVVRDYFNQQFEEPGSGSGIIYKNENGKYYIATNNHVIDGAKKIIVTLEGGQMVEAKITGQASQKDLAVIEILESDISDDTKKNIAIAEFGNSDEIQVGETAIAIGNPLGSEFENSVTQGIISALNREISIDDENFTVIQTDAAINPGNSGGALVNSKGQVIGINSIKIAQSGIEGMGFAIPSNSAVPILDDLIANGTRKKAQLGIMGKNVTQDLGDIYTLPIGVYIVEVTEGGSAEKAGIIATDIITDFNGEKIFSMSDLTEQIKDLNVGDTVDIRIVRNGDTPITLKVTLQAEEE